MHTSHCVWVSCLQSILHLYLHFHITPGALETAREREGREGRSVRDLATNLLQVVLQNAMSVWSKLLFTTELL